MLTWFHVFLIAALVLYLLSWWQGWLAVRRVGSRSGKWWQVGWTLYLFSYFALLRPFEQPLANYALSIAPSSLALVFLMRGLLDEAGFADRWRNSWALGALLSYWVLLLVFIEVGADFTRLSFFIYAVVELWAAYLCFLSGRRWRTNGMNFVAGGALLFVLTNAFRLWEPRNFVLEPRGLEVDLFAAVYMVMLFAGPVVMMTGFVAHNLQRFVMERDKLIAQALTERQLTQQAQQHAQKLSEVVQERDQMLMVASRFNTVSNMGVLNSALAHEMGQPLQAVMLNAQLIEGALQEQDPAVKELGQQLVHSAQRLEQTLRNMRALVVHQNLESGDVELSKVLQTVHEIVSPTLHKAKIQLLWPEITAGLKVKAQAVMLERIVINALVNAHESLTTAQVHQGQVQLTVLESTNTDSQAPTVTLQICDNGPGFAADVLARFGENFVTTKDEGMGLGLALAKAAVAQWEGGMSIGNKPEGGAYIALRLLKAT
jgi:signal transduction histidine kinase